MKASVFIATSVDGYIARPNGEYDFLPTECEPHGYEEFIATVDAHVIGRGTYETVAKFESWAYGKKPVFVLSSQKLDFSSIGEGIVEQMSGPPKQIFAELKARGMRHIYVDGGITIQRFLREGLIHRMVITRIPVIIGEGIPLFGYVPGDIPLRHISTRSFPSGIVSTEYEIPA